MFSGILCVLGPSTSAWDWGACQLENPSTSGCFPLPRAVQSVPGFRTSGLASSQRSKLARIRVSWVSISVVRYWNQINSESPRAYLILPYHVLPWLFQPGCSVKPELECNESLSENLVGWTAAEECSILDGNLQLRLEPVETHEADHLPSKGSLQDTSALSDHFWVFVHMLPCQCTSWHVESLCTGNMLQLRSKNFSDHVTAKLAY